MSEKKDENQPQKDSKESKITVEVSRNAEIESLQAELAKAKKEADEKRVEAEKLAKEKADLAKEKADLEQIKTNVETEREDLKAKLETIAEKEFNAKKEAVLKRVKGVFTNPEDAERAKEIEKNLNDPEKGPENMKQTEYMINILEEHIKKGKEEQEAKIKAEEEKKKLVASSTPTAPKGGQTATLNEQQTGQAPPQTGNKGQAYESEEAMIRDLKQRSMDPKDPVKQAEAKAVLNELWKKWGKTIRKDFEQHTHDATPANYEPTEEEAKKQGTIRNAEHIGKKRAGSNEVD